MKQYTFNLPQLFDKVAKVNRNNSALSFLIGRSVSYEELDIQSNQFANFLLSCELKKGDVVAIFNDKSIDGFCIMLACLKLGIIYTNIDGNSPAERLKRMISTCQPEQFFIPENRLKLLEEVDYDPDKVFIYSSQSSKKIINKQSVKLTFDFRQIQGSTPAYLMFTSGSTGFPKGVVISHANVLNFIKWTQETYKTNTSDRFTNINPLHFDNSVFDFYASIFTGACLIPVSENLSINPRKLILQLNDLKPTIWFSVPSMLVYILKLRALTINDLPDLRIITFGGEGFPKSQLRKLWSILSSRVTFVNVYGPTECTCICSSYFVSDEDILSDELLPLGPIAQNFGDIIIDENGNHVRDGEIGELCITGPNIGLGYYNNMELTKTAFIQNPAHDSYYDIVYKSGDLVKYDAEKDLLHFCGRKDNQIKRMGYRIELEEIENAIGSLDYIEESAAIFNIKINDNGKILAFVRSTNTQEEDIINDLKRKLPSYMLPDQIIFLEHLPKNQNGKIDRLKLKLGLE